MILPVVILKEENIENEYHIITRTIGLSGKSGAAFSPKNTRSSMQLSFSSLNKYGQKILSIAKKILAFLRKFWIPFAVAAAVLIIIVAAAAGAYFRDNPPVAETLPTEAVTVPVTEPEPEIPETTAEPTTEPTEVTEPEPEPETEPEETLPERIHYEEVPLYFQTDYPNTRFGRGTIESHGCGITSLAMVASYMTGHEYLPDELAEYFGGYGLNNMQKLEYGSTKLQLPWKKAKNVHEVMAALREGQLAILLMKEESIFTDSSHFIVVTGINEEGRYTIHDPYKPNYEVWGLKQGFESGFEDYAIVKGYDGAWIYDVNAMPEEPFIYEEIRPYVEPRYPNIQLTPDEELLLAKVIWVEARGESHEGQQAVAEVVFNRMISEDYPDTLQGVLSYENQFPSIEMIDKAEPEQAQYDAIEDALLGPYILPEEVVHFAVYPVNKYVWGTIGGHTFCYRWGTGPDATEATDITE